VRVFRTILIFWVPLIAWLLVIHNFSATPSADLPKVGIPFADKIFHMVEYFVLGVLLIRAFDKSDFKVSLAKLAILAIIISICYGGLDELYQRTRPDRSCDIFDFLADGLGALAGIVIYIADRQDRRG
jgi:VanZ family protein